MFISYRINYWAQTIYAFDKRVGLESWASLGPKYLKRIEVEGLPFWEKNLPN